MTKNIVKLAAPLILALFLEVLMELINTVFIGRLGNTTYLAGLGLAHIIFNLICIQPMMGINSAQETFVSQAFGAKDLELCG